jgi:hypothetical protein
VTVYAFGMLWLCVKLPARRLALSVVQEDVEVCWVLGDPVEKNAIAPTATTPRSMAITLVFRFVPFLAHELRIQSSCNQRLLPGQSGLSKPPSQSPNEREGILAREKSASCSSRNRYTSASAR